MVTFLAIGGGALALLAITLLVGDFLDGIFDALDFSGGYLSSTAVLSFLATFGLVGALLMATTDMTALVAAVCGLAAGALVGAGAGIVTKVLVDSPTAHQVTTADYLGQQASVTTTIPVNGLGQVHLTVAGYTTALAARAAEPIPAGTTVVVVANLTPGTVRVERVP